MVRPVFSLPGFQKEKLPWKRESTTAEDITAQIHEEAAAVLYSNNTLSFQSPHNPSAGGNLFTISAPLWTSTAFYHWLTSIGGNMIRSKISQPQHSLCRLKLPRTNHSRRCYRISRWYTRQRQQKISLAKKVWQSVRNLPAEHHKLATLERARVCLLVNLRSWPHDRVLF